MEEAGGPSVEEYVAGMGNLAKPFGPYKLDTLKLVSETRAAWVLLAEPKNQELPWTNRLTLDKTTGFLQKVEALIPEFDEPVVLVRVNRVSPKREVDASIFRMELPAADSPDSPYVQDNTGMWLESIKAQKRAGQTKDPAPSPSK